MLPDLAAHEDSFDSRFEQDVAEKHRHREGRRGHAEAARDGVRRLVEHGLLRRARDPRDRTRGCTLLTNSLPAMSVVGSSEAAQRRPDRARRRLPPADPLVRRRRDGARDPQLLRRPARVLGEGDRARGLPHRPDPLEAEVKRAMIARSRTVVLVAAAQKFDERGLSVIVSAGQVDSAYLADPPPRASRRSPPPASKSRRLATASTDRSPLRLRLACGCRGSSPTVMS